MDDRFLHGLRREPRPEFAEALRGRLRAREEVRRPRPLWVPALGAAAAILIVGLFAFPSVRVSAQNLLDIFRVRRFAAVKFDAARIDQLKSLGDNEMMVLERHETVTEPGPAQFFTTTEAAGTAAGITVRSPGFLPSGLLADSICVQGAGEVRLAVSSDKVDDLLRKLDIHDVTVPAHLDGDWIDVRKPPIVIQSFRSGKGNVRAAVAQAKSPEVTVPAGVDIEQFAEMGLRILGLDSGEARRMARATDWRTTLLVPVPINASTFRQVTVHGQSGLLVTTSGMSQEGDRHREGTIILWTEGDEVFALRTNLGPEEAMQMADSVQ